MDARQRVLQDTENMLDDMADHIEGMIGWALDEGYTAIAHKLQEAWNPLLAASAAADQYKTGELRRSE